MYEEMTYTNIMNGLMEEMPDDIDTSEGSLIYNSCAKMAAALEEVYSAASDLYDNMEVDTQDLDYLISGGAENGCPIIDATAAVFTAQFNCALDSGTRLEAPDTDYTYYVTDLISDADHTYYIESEDPGTEANSYIGEIEPVDYVEGFETGTILTVYSPGTDQEDEDVYRERRINFYSAKPFAGNRAYYKEIVDAISGVGGCKASRGASGGLVDVIIISAAYGVPTASLISAVQTAVDPTSGTGDGAAPIGATVTVSGVAGTTVNISATITFSGSTTYEDVKSYIEAAIDTYFASLGATWEDAADALVVRMSKVELALLDIEGITDVEHVAFNGTESNLTLATDHVPVRGTFTCN